VYIPPSLSTKRTDPEVRYSLFTWFFVWWSLLYVFVCFLFSTRDREYNLKFWECW
jgi:hypothetical protein